MWNYQQNHQRSITPDLKRTEDSVLKRTSYFDAYSGKNSPSNSKVVIEPRNYQERPLKSNGLYSGGKQIAASQPVLNESGKSGFFKGTYPYRSSKHDTNNNENESSATKKKGFFQEIRKKFNSQRGSPPKPTKTTPPNNNDLRRPPVQTYFWDQNQQQTEKLKSLPRQGESQKISTFAKPLLDQKQPTQLMTIGTYAERQKYRPKTHESVTVSSNSVNSTHSSNRQYQNRPNLVQPTPSFRHIGVQTELIPINTQKNIKHVIPNGINSNNTSFEPKRRTVMEMSTNFMTNNQSEPSDKRNTNKPNLVNGISFRARDSHLQNNTNSQNFSTKDTVPIYMKAQSRKSWHPPSESKYGQISYHNGQIVKNAVNSQLIQNEHTYNDTNYDSKPNPKITHRKIHQEEIYSTIDDEPTSGRRYERSQPAHTTSASDAPRNVYPHGHHVTDNQKISIKPVPNKNNKDLLKISFKEELESTLRRKKGTSKISRDYEIPESFGKRNQVPSYQSYQEVAGENGDGDWEGVNEVIYKDYSAQPASDRIDRFRQPMKPKSEPNHKTYRSSSGINTVPVPPPPPKDFQLNTKNIKYHSNTTRSVKGVPKPSGNMEQQRSMLMEQIRNARSDRAFYVVGDDSDDDSAQHNANFSVKQSISNKNPSNFPSTSTPTVNGMTPYPDYD